MGSALSWLGTIYLIVQTPVCLFLFLIGTSGNINQRWADRLVKTIILTIIASIYTIFALHSGGIHEPWQWVVGGLALLPTILVIGTFTLVILVLLRDHFTADK